MSKKMNGGMKIISADGTRVLARNDPEIRALLLSELKTAEKVEIVSTGSAYSLIVRVSLRDGLFRDDLVGEDDALMHGDERWLPTTGKPIREVILKFMLVSDPTSLYEYDSDKHHKGTMLQPDVVNEYKQQLIAFDATKHHAPLCPDVIALIPFLTQSAFDETFFTKPIKNKQYSTCRVFQKLRIYFSLPFKPHVAMIVMESIPATYVPLKKLFKGGGISPDLIAQICAMYVVLFHMCKMVALDAHWSNWLVDMMKEIIQLRVKLIDYGLSLDTLNTDEISKIVNTYFETHPTELPAYLRLMGAKPSDSPSEVMTKAIKSVSVPIAPMESWIHKILVISMLIDGFFTVNHSPKQNPSKPIPEKLLKTTCQMKTVFNVVYDNACVSMSNILRTLSLDLPTYLALQSQEKSQRIHAMLRNMASYMEIYYALRPRSGMDEDEEGMDEGGMDAMIDQATGSLRRGGNKTNNTRKPMKQRKQRKQNKQRNTNTKKSKMHRK
jgi:hypothetical protein